jgi:hypothetical protein
MKVHASSGSGRGRPPDLSDLTPRQLVGVRKPLGMTADRKGMDLPPIAVRQVHGRRDAVVGCQVAGFLRPSPGAEVDDQPVAGVATRWVACGAPSGRMAANVRSLPSYRNRDDFEFQDLAHGALRLDDEEMCAEAAGAALSEVKSARRAAARLRKQET